MERKELLKRLKCLVVASSIALSSSAMLSGCGKKDDISNGQEYIVLYNDNNAVIFDSRNTKYYYTPYSGNIRITDGDKGYVSSNYIVYTSYSLEEVEEQVYELIGKDGNITYHNFDEEKTLKKTK